MKVSYNGLWKILIDKNMNKTDLQERIGISPGTIAKMGKGEFVSMEVLYRIATALDVDFGDMVSVNTGEEKEFEK
ncbi:helix-turn-helix domain-containing protein [Anaerosphaera multitolerans]|uniref:XRE family transcriptional regulator n=1 Tax=Anaerosphaera multitolerans TaxID=2487351 RepID=A0A437S9R5_9FIRM|nr:helix-turn-helix transcriptional regulator [Anaerosphaera multitolerans]RVU55859.1 XRE family transcriptional regulator [Anaerosphaera multitolerans]